MNIQDTIPFGIITELLEKECNSSSIEEAKLAIQELIPIRGNGIPEWELPLEMKKRFNFLKQIIFTINSKDEATFCKQKYITYRILELTQNFFKGEKMYTPGEKAKI